MPAACETDRETKLLLEFTTETAETEEGQAQHDGGGTTFRDRIRRRKAEDHVMTLDISEQATINSTREIEPDGNGIPNCVKTASFARRHGIAQQAKFGTIEDVRGEE